MELAKSPILTPKTPAPHPSKNREDPALSGVEGVGQPDWEMDCLLERLDRSRLVVFHVEDCI